MERIAWFEHKGKRILMEDYSGISPAELPALLEKAHRLIAAEPLGSVLAIANVHGTHYDRDASDRMKAFVKSNTPFIKATAVVGLSGLQTIVYQAIVKLTGRRNFYVIDSAGKARDFLAGLG
jgi:hypothetical protein